MLHLVASDAMSTLCSICLHLDEMLEYKHGGAVIVPVCMFNHAHFNLVKRYDQCRDFTDINRQDADHADTDTFEQLAGSACSDNNHSSANATD